SILDDLAERADTEQASQDLYGEIRETLDKLRELVSREYHEQLAELYSVAVYQLAGSFEKSVVIQQHENRFQALEQDPMSVRAGKFLKRLFRKAGRAGHALLNLVRRAVNRPEKGYSAPSQQIPLKQLVEYHLFSQQELPRWWINDDERLLLEIILSLEEFLAEFCTSDRSDDEERSELLNLVDQFKDRIEEQQQTLTQELQEDHQAVTKLLLHHIEKAGTFEQGITFYTTNRINRVKTRTSQVLEKHAGKWQEVLDALLEKTSIINEFLAFRNRLYSLSSQFSERVDQYLDHSIFSDLAELDQKIAQIHSELQEIIPKKNDKAQLATLESALAELDGRLTELTQTLGEELEDNKLAGMADSYTEDALLMANEVAEDIIFVHDLKTDRNPPAIDRKTIEWRLLVVRSLKEQVLHKIGPDRQGYVDFVRQRLNELNEVQDVIDVNLRSSIELAQKSGEENPMEIARQALERSRLKLEQLQQAADGKRRAIDAVLTDDLDTFSDKLLNLLHTGNPGDLQIMDAKYRVREKAQDWRTVLKARWARIEDSAALLLRFLQRKARKTRTAISTSLGFRTDRTPEQQQAEIANYLTETDNKVEDLPYIYRRLFNFSEETDRRFYIALNENFHYVKKAYDNWEQGFSATFAVVGEKGSGKTSYLDYAAADIFTDRSYTRFTLEETIWTEEALVRRLAKELNLDGADSVDAAIEQLNRKRKNRIVILESIQNLYLRNLNGYQGLEALLYIISQTKEHMFWIVSCSSYAWHFLHQTTQLADYFSHILETDGLTPQQVESVIMKRHEASGFELLFESNETLNKNRAYRKLMDKEDEAQQYLKETYFEELAKLADGNASIAMIFWLRSIRAYDDIHFYIKPLEVTSLELVEELTPDILFTLAAVILHDTITAGQLSEVLQFTPQESQLILTRLKSRGLLQIKNGNYTLNHLMYRQVVRVLKQRNIIHLY
ncbi:MAG: hypothetical protein R3281_11300, partial [Balneolaceae bacterium]|nr:hypothetical protein [Balneolaceae bacterium]